MAVGRWTAIVLVTGVLAAGLAFVAGSATRGSGGSDVAPASAVDGGTTTTDLSGPCDAREHAADPRCAGVKANEPMERSRTRTLDLSGPCDEPEHANDPRCAGVAVPRTSARRVDVSGPCDEPEHANDPRCTGAADDDSRGSGHGRGRSGTDDGGGRSGHGGGR